ncbi:MAG: transglutaminase domain-containing protein [Salinivirgaceae bacterium]|nr:transglutaminase domain-containing protein [Salinivirgaceae bacterium]
MKNIIFTILIFTVIGTNGQSFDDFKKQTDAKFTSFKDASNAKFEAFKKVSWQKFETLKLEHFAFESKPYEIPEAPVQTDPIPPTPIFNEDIEPVVVPDPLPNNDIISRLDPEFKSNLIKIADYCNYKVEVDYFDVPIPFYYHEFNFKLDSINGIHFNKAVNQIQKFDKEINKIILYQLKNYVALMKLNDWALIQLAFKTGQAVFKNDNKARVFAWAMLSLMNYDCKLAFTPEGVLAIVVQANAELCWEYRLIIDENAYFFATLSNDEYQLVLEQSVYTYDENPFNASEPFSILFDKAPSINTKLTEKARSTRTHEFNMACDVSYVKMLETFPKFSHEIYYSIPLSEKTLQHTRKQIMPYIKGKSEYDAVSFILNFVQFGFPYQFDKIQFGVGDRPQAAEELFYYPYSDCEDHSALFAQLVKEFVGIEVAGILYRTHATTAVKFSGPQNSGEHLPAPFQDFIVCDPTYIGAEIGLSMPQFRGVTPEKIWKVK